MSNGGGREDTGLLQPSIDTGLSGVEMVAQAISRGTPEMARLLREECELVLECKYATHGSDSEIFFCQI